MTRRDFILIAETIRIIHAEGSMRASEARIIAEQFAEALAGTNAGFDRARFMEAAMKGAK